MAIDREVSLSECEEKSRLELGSEWKKKKKGGGVCIFTVIQKR